MLTKLLFAILTLGAFAYVLLLRLRGKTCPKPQIAEPGETLPLRTLFLLATATLYGCLAPEQTAVSQPKESPQAPLTTVTCYAQMVPITQPIPFHRFLTATWMALNAHAQMVKAKEETDLRQAVENFEKDVAFQVQAQELSPEVGNALILAYREMAYHLWQNNAEEVYGMSCYEDGPPPKAATAELLNKQLELLREQKAKGALSPEVIAKAEAAIARDIEALLWLKADPETRTPRTSESPYEIAQKGLPPSSVATSTAKIILSLEQAEQPKPSATAAQPSRTDKERK